ncbi:nuclear transport factor 2 family protein [Paraburkholderia guartelaensis]|uniref:nuclear transport factor 2 family protein n=1 Tax=Paraburkholderia guartelaensis TaxID=2546446 RepID=UPI002AB7A20E|nr:nuclear transport factor 2 family protein [Paraburkholderia guartelaensis]
MSDFTIKGGVATIHNEELFATWESRADYYEALTAAESPVAAAHKRLLMDFEVALSKVVRAGRIHEDIDAVLERFIGDVYIQHDPNVGDGREALAASFREVPAPESPPIPVNFVVEGDLVSMLLQRRLPDPHVPGARYDMYMPVLFRVRDGKFVEHWDSREKM